MQLDKEIDKCNQMVLLMCEEVRKNIRDAFIAYKQESEITEINDDIVDQYERLIEEMCLDILVKERLYSRDLRIVTGILKLVSDLERIGDHACDILEFTLKLKDEDEKPCEMVEEMVNKAIDMLDSAIKGYLTKDLTMSKKVIETDDIIDKMYIEAVQKLIDKDSTRSYAIYTTLIVKYIERIADHTVNISEWVIYMINGFYKDKVIF